MYMTQGVKQGCNLSPILFNIFLVDIIQVVHNLGYGINIGKDKFSVISFADDVILIVKCVEHMSMVINIVNKLFDEINMVISEVKSKIMRFGKVSQLFKDSEGESLGFTQVLECRYLGVTVNNKASKYFGNFAADCVKKCVKYRGSIMNKAKSSYDPVFVVTELWSKVAVSSILYGAEVLPIKQKELRMMDSEAALIGKFALQLPSNSTNVISSIVAGVKTMTYEYYKRVLAYRARLEEKDDKCPTKRVYNYMKSHRPKHSYIVMVEELDQLLDGRDLDSWYIDYINSERLSSNSTCWLIPEMITNTREYKFKLHEFSEEGKIYAEFITMNAGLGNRAPVLGQPQHKWCKLCEVKNMDHKLNEVHMLFECIWMEEARKNTILKEFIQSRPNKTPWQLYREYFLGSISNFELRTRVQLVGRMRQVFWEVQECL